MTDKPKDENSGAKKGNEPPELEPKLKGDYIDIPLRDGISMLIKMETSTRAMVIFGSDKGGVVAPLTGQIFSAAFRREMTKAATAEFGNAAPHIGEDIERAMKKLAAPTGDGKTLLSELQAAGKRSVMDRLVLYASAAAEFFHNADREGFASVVRGEHQENYELEDPEFKIWLRQEFWEREKDRMEEEQAARQGGLFEGTPAETEMPTVVREADVTDAVSQLKALARFEGPQHEVHIRTARGPDSEAGNVYLDLGDEEWRAIEIKPFSWRIVKGEDIPVKFIRPKGLLPFPDPVPSGEGSLEPLGSLVNLGEGEEGERNRTLILAWLSQAFLPTGPYPVLTLGGPQGSAKSHAVKILRNLVDPNTAPTSTKPRDEHNTYLDAAANQVMAYDNMPSCPQWLSNVLCDIATGGGFRTRTLYTNRQQEIFQDTRPIILAGIGNIATRPDLLERAVMVELPRIAAKKRRLERVIKQELPKAQPVILSALLDAVAEGLARVESVKMDELPRMADFAVWGVATEQALGGEEGAFMAAYGETREVASTVALENWPLTDTFVAFANRYTEEKPWEGTPADLLEQLGEFASEELRHSKAWPDTPAVFGREISIYESDLLEQERVVVEKTERTKRSRGRRVYRQPEKAE